MSAPSENEQAHNEVAANVSQDDFEKAFTSLTDGDGHQHGVFAHSQAHVAHSHPWLQKMIPGLENVATSHHAGNFYAATRGPNPEKVWESMPIYARLGMHILFYGRAQSRLLHTERIENMFKAQSVKEGKAFDAEEGALAHIEGFVKDYSLEDTLEQLKKPNLRDYRTFNEFFSREIKPEARPIDGGSDPSIVVSAADCRLTVFEDVSAAREFWIKDHTFSVSTLLDDQQLASTIGDEPSLAIFRLAPADYHRWHSPVAGKLGEIKHLPGQYYTVNPQAVNEDFAVFTANRRDVTVVNAPSLAQGGQDVPVAMVAIGALLVGAITWLKEGSGASFEKGEPQGYFSYGGSTVVALFPKGSVKFDDDLVTNSRNRLETKVAVGNQIGRRL